MQEVHLEDLYEQNQCTIKVWYCSYNRNDGILVKKWKNYAKIIMAGMYAVGNIVWHVPSNYKKINITYNDQETSTLN